ncbi:MAG: hypothetical protein AB1601_09725 [Planctomycetota bacterium]
MPASNLPTLILDAAARHLPDGAAWILIAAGAVVGGIGLLFMVKGARLAPMLAALVVAAFGAGAGPVVSNLTHAPLWPVVAGCGVVGLGLGVLLFRVWLAILVGLCLAGAGLSIYTGQVLRDPLNAYLTSGLDREQQLVTLPTPGDAGGSPTWTAEATQLWNHLTGNVPNFQASFFALVLSTAVGGFILGLAFPRLARAFWAASFGTGLLLSGVYGVLHAGWPAGLPWVNQWGPMVAGVMWGISMVYNLVDLKVFGTRKAAATPEPAKAGA